MTLETQILNTITAAKSISIEWAAKFATKYSYGDKIGCCEDDLITLNNWIGVLCGYYCDVYENNTTACITEAEILILIGKVNKLSC